MSAALLQSIVDGTAPEIVPLSVEQYHRMIADGILPDGAAIELIDGMLVRKERGALGERGMVHNSRHAGVVAILHVLLTQALGTTGAHVRSQLPVTLANDQEPEPDLAVIMGEPRRYLKNHPGPADILLVIEIADSSLKFDRTVKERIYATAGIPNYWIVNLVDGSVETFQQPDVAKQSYSRRESYRRDSELPLVLDGKSITKLPVRDILPD